MPPTDVLADAPGADAPTRSESRTSTWVIEPRSAGVVARSRDIVRSRHLFRHFALEALRRRYKKTILGWVWILIRAVLPILINTLVFNQLARIETGATPYFLFLTVGFAIWSLFAEGLMWATRSLQMFSKLLAKIYFPRLILPFAAMAPALVNFAIYLGMVVAIAGYYVVANNEWHLSFGPNLLYTAGAIVMCLGFALGLGLFTAVLGAETRDLRFTLPFVFQFWFILTPVAYPLSLVSDRWWWTTYVNPMTPIVQMFRAGLLGEELGMGIPQIGLTALLIALTLAAGLWFFSRAEASAVDRL